MARTHIASGSDQAVKKYSAFLASQFLGQSFWFSKLAGKRFFRENKVSSYMSTSPNMPIQILRDLQKDAGDTIYYDIVNRLSGSGVEGDARLAGNEEKLTLYSDSVKIDQIRHGVDVGGRMSRKRTVHDLRRVARDQLSDWFVRWADEVVTCYLAGMRGTGTNQWLLPTTWTGFASNALESPDTDHHIVADASYPTSNDDVNDLAAGDVMSKDLLDYIIYKISTMDVPPHPISVGDDGPKYVLVMDPASEWFLRDSFSAGDWGSIQQYAGVRGLDNPIFKYSLGTYRNLILYSYSKIPTGTNASSVGYARCLLLGAQALVMASGSPGNGLTFDWIEEYEDRQNVLVVDVGTICGFKKVRFNSQDHGVVAVSVATQRA